MNTTRAALTSTTLAAALALSGCIETVPQADGSTRVRMGPGVAMEQARKTQHADAGKLATAPVLDGVDWTPMFKGMERGCDITPELHALLEEMRRTRESKGDRNKRLTSSFDLKRVAQPYRSALAPKVQLRYDDELRFSLPVNKGSYHGLPVRSILYNEVPETDMADYILLLGVPPAQAQQALRHVRFQASSAEACSSRSMTMAPKRVNGQEMTLLVCDISC